MQKRALFNSLAALLAFGLASGTGARAQEKAGSGWNLDGAISAEPYAAWAPAGASYGSAATTNLVLGTKGEQARAEASLETSILSGAAAEEAWLLSATPYGRSDELLVPESASAKNSPPDTLVAMRMRSLYLKLDFDKCSLTAGRQFVNYGLGAIWSPTDIFNELDLAGVSPERLGTDALRLSVPFGATENLDLVAAPATAPADGRYALRARGFVGDGGFVGGIDGIDGALMAARDGPNRGWIFGADFKADIEIGLYGAGTCELYDSGHSASIRAALGADWSFGDFIVAAEYYYNGGGAAADTLFPGTHNAYGSIVWKATELFQLSDTAVWNIRDRALTDTLLATLSAAQNASVAAFVQGGYGTATYGLDLGRRGAGWSAQTGLRLEVKF